MWQVFVAKVFMCNSAGSWSADNAFPWSPPSSYHSAPCGHVWTLSLQDPSFWSFSEGATPPFCCKSQQWGAGSKGISPMIFASRYHDPVLGQVRCLFDWFNCALFLCQKNVQQPFHSSYVLDSFFPHTVANKSRCFLCCLGFFVAQWQETSLFFSYQLCIYIVALVSQSCASKVLKYTSLKQKVHQPVSVLWLLSQGGTQRKQLVGDRPDTFPLFRFYSLSVCKVMHKACCGGYGLMGTFLKGNWFIFLC